MRPLSPREQDILDAAASGLTYREMARRFYLAESTVKNTAARMLRDLEARTIAHAVAKWMLVRDDYARARDRPPPDLSAIVGDAPPVPGRPATLDEYIAAHLAASGDADCTLWTGAMDGARPIVHTAREGVSVRVSVRRHLYESAHGPIAAGLYVHAACPHGRPRCLSHVAVGGRGRHLHLHLLGRIARP